MVCPSPHRPQPLIQRPCPPAPAPRGQWENEGQQPQPLTLREAPEPCPGGGTQVADGRHEVAAPGEGSKLWHTLTFAQNLWGWLRPCP